MLSDLPGGAVVFDVPGQPQGKGRARIVKVGGFSRMATPETTVAYEGLVAHSAQQAMAGRPPIEGAVVVRLTIRCQIPASWSARKKKQALIEEIVPTTKPDIDNVAKAIFDGCNGVLWKDDSQISTALIVKRYSDRPGVTVYMTAANRGV